MQKIMNLKKWVEDYETLSSKHQDLEVLIEFQKKRGSFRRGGRSEL